jgi:hypothetical protein
MVLADVFAAGRRVRRVHGPDRNVPQGVHGKVPVDPPFLLRVDFEILSEGPWLPMDRDGGMYRKKGRELHVDFAVRLWRLEIQLILHRPVLCAQILYLASNRSGTLTPSSETRPSHARSSTGPDRS